MNDPLIIEQCVVQLPIVFMFFTAVFVVDLMQCGQIGCMGLFLFAYIY
jgi:hypothetical protein